MNIETLHDLWPHSKIPLQAIADQAADVFTSYGLSSPLVIAHFMAQISEETAGATELVENLNYSSVGLINTWPSRFDSERAGQYAHKPQEIANFVYNGRMGNRLGTDDGWNYRGRGATQTTGRESYEKLGDSVRLDLISNPDWLNDPKHFLECGAADFVKLCGCLPWAEQDNLVQVTRHLNGGMNGYQQRKDWLVKWKSALLIVA